MRSSILGILLLTTSHALAAPPPELDGRAINCAAVNSVINYFTKYTSQASSFCSAYLQTSTTVDTTVPATTKTIAVKAASTVTTTIYVTANTIVKRDNTAARPTWLPAAIAGQVLSTACLCYVPSPTPKTITRTTKFGTKTTTKTVTATATVTTTIYCRVWGCFAGGDFTEEDGLTPQQCIAKCPTVTLDNGGRCDTILVGEPNLCLFLTGGVAANRYAESPEDICGGYFFYDYRCKV